MEDLPPGRGRLHVVQDVIQIETDPGSPEFATWIPNQPEGLWIGFRMELHPMQEARRILDALDRREGSGDCVDQTRRQVRHDIGVTRKHIELVRQAIEQFRGPTCGCQVDGSVAQFEASGVRGDPGPENAAHQLVAVADAQNRHPGIAAPEDPFAQLQIHRIVRPGIPGRTAQDHPVPTIGGVQFVDVGLDPDPEPIDPKGVGRPTTEPTADIAARVGIQTRRPNHGIDQKHPPDCCRHRLDPEETAPDRSKASGF